MLNQNANDEKDALELQLIESFQNLKIVDMPKFRPTKSQKIISTKTNPQKIQQDSSKIFNKDGNIESCFFSDGFDLNKYPKGIYDKVARVITFPNKNNEFIDDRINKEEEDDDDIDGEFNINNEYPDTSDEDSDSYKNPADHALFYNYTEYDFVNEIDNNDDEKSNIKQSNEENDEINKDIEPDKEINNNNDDEKILNSEDDIPSKNNKEKEINNSNQKQIRIETIYDINLDECDDSLKDEYDDFVC